MSSGSLNWYSGTRGPYPGKWLVYRDSKSPRFTETPPLGSVQLSVGPLGDIRPWDWCCDAMYFDPTYPWLAFIPTLDRENYESSAKKQSWIFPSNSKNPGNFRRSSRGGYTASMGIIDHAPIWLFRIKRLADDLAQVHRWPHPLPDIPNTETLAHRQETSDQVQALLWIFRRPLLSLLGFIHYFLSHHYLCRQQPARHCPALQDEVLFDFVHNHLFNGQSYRGVLIDTEQFCKQCEANPASCEPILQLLDPKVNSPIPLVVHQPSPYREVGISRLNAVLSFRALKSRLGSQKSYMMRDSASRSGVLISNSKIAARARAHYHSVTLQSELDGVNLILFFFDQEDMDKDDNDLPELEPSDFGGFEKMFRLPDALFLYDSRIRPETLLAPQQPTFGDTPNVPNLPKSRPGEEVYPAFKFKLTTQTQTSNEDLMSLERWRQCRKSEHDH